MTERTCFILPLKRQLLTNWKETGCIGFLQPAQQTTMSAGTYARILSRDGYNGTGCIRRLPSRSVWSTDSLPRSVASCWIWPTARGVSTFLYDSTILPATLQCSGTVSSGWRRSSSATEYGSSISISRQSTGWTVSIRAVHAKSSKGAKTLFQASAEKWYGTGQLSAIRRSWWLDEYDGPSHSIWTGDPLYTVSHLHSTASQWLRWKW